MFTQDGPPGSPSFPGGGRCTAYISDSRLSKESALSVKVTCPGHQDRNFSPFSERAVQVKRLEGSDMFPIF